MFQHTIKKGIYALLILAASQTWASNSNIDIAADPSLGAINPINVQTLTGESEGSKFLSFTASILETLDNNIASTISDVTAPFEEWSYNRGMGILPNSCQEGYSANSGM